MRNLIIPVFCSLLFVAVVLFSCGTMKLNRTSDFAGLSSADELKGAYQCSYYPAGRSVPISILSLFHIPDSAETVIVSSANTDEITLAYQSEGVKKTATFKGKIKKNFFEIYFSKKQTIIPLIFSYCDIDRLRIGLATDGGLLIRHFDDRSGNILFLGYGHSVEPCYVFSRFGAQSAANNNP